MSSEVESYLKQKNWDYRPQGDDFVVKVCPFCASDKWKFFIHSKMGIYQCWSGDCGVKGNLYTLKVELGDLTGPSKAIADVWGDDVSYDVVSHEDVQRLHDQLLNNVAALQYLYGRFIGDAAIKQFKLGVEFGTDGQWLTFPYFKEGQCVNIKYRSLPPKGKEFRIKAKHERPLYNCDSVKVNAKEITIVEGEMDCISTVLMGFENVVSLPMGAENFEAEHWDFLVPYERINLILDHDGAGRSGVQKLILRLGDDRCYNVRIPNGMDPNDLLKKYQYEEGAKRLRACIDDAKPAGRGNVASVNIALKELEDHITQHGNLETGFSTPWSSVNRIIGCVSPGEVMLLQAIPKTGKTTLAQQWLAWLSKQYSVPTLMYCLENPLWRLAQSLVASHCHAHREKLNLVQTRMTYLAYKDIPFYYGAIPKEWTFEVIKEVITYSVRRFGIQFVCFDNLQLICRNANNPYNEQAVVSRDFKRLISELNIALLLIVQPRKINPRSVPGIYDPSGTGSIIADADGMISMWRRPLQISEEGADDDVQSESMASFSPETLIRVPASRYRAGGQTIVYFDEDRATFVEVDASRPLTPESVPNQENSSQG